MSTQDVLDRVDREGAAYLDELKDFLRIPSISTDPQYKGEVRRAAEWLRDRMAAAGLAAELIETEGNPLVYGEWTGAPGKPTVLFYGHYDVQPADPLEEWRNPPFEPTIERDPVRGDRLVARGATDDKGQSYAHVKAIGAILAERGELPVNVKIVCEGEEESGGAAIDRFVREDAGARLGADCVVVSDTSMYAPGQPSLIYGLQGARLHGGARSTARTATSTPAPTAAAVTNPRERAGAPGRVAARPGDRPDPDPRLLRPRPPARGVGARGVRGAAVRRGGVQGRAGGRRALRRGGLLHPRARSGRGRPATSTASAAATWARGRRPCSRRAPAPRSRCAWCPTSSRPRSRERSKPTSRRTRPRDVRSRCSRSTAPSRC